MNGSGGPQPLAHEYGNLVWSAGFAEQMALHLVAFFAGKEVKLRARGTDGKVVVKTLGKAA